MSIFFLILCTSSEKDLAESLDAGPPPRPLFFEFEGLGFGMTPDEIEQAWGPALEKSSYQMNYADKGGYKHVQLYFMSVPAFSNIHADVKRSEISNDPFFFLLFLQLSYAYEDVRPKETVRPDLITRFGNPLDDPVLYEKMHVTRETADIFRAAECTLAIVRWYPASPEIGRPEHLGHITFRIAPDALMTDVPRTRWKDLRGAISVSPTDEIKAHFEKLSQVHGGAAVDEVVKLLGPPNLYMEETPGQGQIVYYWLDGARIKFNIEEGKVQGYMSSF
jgi:hypothetical protein